MQERIQPYHRCRYKGSQTVPYLSYKEEIISLAPYVSLFYDIISDAEINTMTDHVKNKVRRTCRDVSYWQLSARKVCILELSNSETASRLVCTVHIRFCCFVSVCAMYFNLSFSVWQCWHSLRWHYVSYTRNRGVHAGTLFFSVCILLRKGNEGGKQVFRWMTHSQCCLSLLLCVGIVWQLVD